MSILLVLDPLSNILISILVVICSLTMLLTIQPVSFVLLTVGVGEDPKSIFAILVPFSIIDGSTSIVINASAVLLAI